jgi:hypothetical protein
VSQVVNGHRPPFKDNHYPQLVGLFDVEEVEQLHEIAIAEREALTWQNRSDLENELLTELALSRKREPEGHLDPDVIRRLLDALKKKKSEDH